MSEHANISEQVPDYAAITPAPPVPAADEFDELNAALAAAEIESDTFLEVLRLRDLVAELHSALSASLTCTAIWCMCEAHQLLRDTEGEEGLRWP